MSEEYYNAEIAPILQAAEILLTQANIPYLILIRLDDETLEWQHNFPYEGLKCLNVTLYPGGKEPGFVPVPDVTAMGKIVEGGTTQLGAFGGNAVAFGEQNELEDRLGSGN